MILDVDMGNSRIKWRSSARPQQIFAHTDDWQVQDQWRALSGVARVRIAAVVDVERVGRMVEWVWRELQVEAEVARVEDAVDGLHLAYLDPASLGVDRWLALLAAKQRFDQEDVVVVSAGTALTVDYLDSSSRHRGGYIIPGWRVAVSALLGDTDRIVCLQPQLKKDWQPGVSTLNCVEAGLAFMYRSVLNAASQPGWADFDAANVLITGGDGEMLASFGSGQVACTSDPLLILRGLAVALP